MPWGRSSWREPAPQRLTLDELLELQRSFQPAPRPEAVRSLSDLDPEDRRRVQQQSLWEGLAAAGASMQAGDWRYAGQAAGDIARMQEGALQDANARREAEWQNEQQRRAAEFQQQEKETQTAAIYGMYERAVEGEAPDSPFVARAEAAARAGNMSELATLASPEVKGKRAGARAKGYDPDAWDTNERLTQELAAELERQKAAAAEAQELERKRKEAAIEQEAAIAQEKAMRELGPAPQWMPPLSRIEAEEAIRERHRASSTGATQRIMEANGVPGLAQIDPATGSLKWTPASGVPDPPGKVQVFKNEDGEQAPYRLHSDGSWYPMKVAPAGATPPPVPEPSAADRSQALGLRNKITAGLLGSTPPPADWIERLRAQHPQGIGGFSIERIIEEARAQARRRGWKG